MKANELSDRLRDLVAIHGDREVWIDETLGGPIGEVSLSPFIAPWDDEAVFCLEVKREPQSSQRS